MTYTAAEITARIQALQTKIEGAEGKIELLMGGTDELAMPYSVDGESINPAAQILALRELIAEYQERLAYWEERLRVAEGGGGFITSRVFGVSS